MNILEQYWATRTPLTREAYQSDWRQFCEFLECDPNDIEKIKTINVETMEKFFSSKKRWDAERKLENASTIARKYAAIRSIFKWLHKRGHIESNPADRLDGCPRPSKISSQKGLTKEEVRALLDAAASQEGSELQRLRDTALLLLLVYGGLRREEVVLLRMCDLYVKKVKDEKHVVILIRGKGDKDREIPLRDEVFDALKKYREEVGDVDFNPENKNAIFGSCRSTQSMREKNRRMTPDSINVIVKRIAEKAGVKDVSPHTFRHFAITEALNGGVPLERVRRFAGHANISSTTHYFHEGDDLSKNATFGINLGGQ